MADDIRSVVAQSGEELAVRIGSLSCASQSDIEKIREGAKRLYRMLAWFRATLDDAENLNIANEPVRAWLRELGGLADAVEDLLDEFPYQATRLGLMEDGRWTPGSGVVVAIDAVLQVAADLLPRQGARMRKTELQVCHPPSSPTHSHEIFAFLYHVKRRMEKINSEFGKIKKHRQALQWEEYGDEETHVETMSTRRPTGSLMQEPCIFGRSEDLETVKKFLLSSDAESSSSTDNSMDVAVMAIVGMGGLGKTTLAQLAYNDDEVNRHFHLRSWVCVSEDFDIIRLTRAMVESLTQEACSLSELDPLQRMLEARLTGQRFLLVFDDVWEGQELSRSWDLLRAPLRNVSAGSKIIITTRTENVSKLTRASLSHSLPCLQEEDCLKLFAQWAFEGREPNSCQRLIAIGVEIARKCRGLPLAAKTLGGLLHSVDGERTWKTILESDVWNINGGNEVMPALRLSYQHLPPHLKRCFRYCSVFPKGYTFDMDQLICMWMAHGYVKTKGRELMEDIGKRYFADLLSRSFFQYARLTSNMFQMHDLIHDLARSASEGECCSLKDKKPYRLQRYVRHFSINPPDDPLSFKDSSKYKCGSESLRSFLFIVSSDILINIKLANNFFTRMKHLRVLDLSRTATRVLPDSIGCLKHLRYLSIGAHAERLPESVGSLYHLQTLDIRSFTGCLPYSISNLLSLRHIYGRSSTSYPEGIGKLTNLQTMSSFHVSSNYGHAKLGELKAMKNIRNLVIDRISSLIEVDDAKEACLDKKEHLSSLDLVWLKRAGPLPSENDEILESLKPCSKLQRLRMAFFCGQCFPSWLGDRSFYKLTNVTLDQCQNWTSLPPLGQLPSLEQLLISAAMQVKYIDRGFFSGGFPKLEKMILTDMDSWNSWCGAQKGECPQLQELHIERCKCLECLPVVNLDALKNLKINGCPKLQCSLDSLQLPQLPSLQKVNVETIAGVDLLQGGDVPRGGILSLQTSCLQLDNVGISMAPLMLGACSHIRLLSVTRCPDLTDLPLGYLNALECVKIRECPQLQFSNDEQFPSTLQILEIDMCPSMTSLPLGIPNATHEVCGCSYLHRLILTRCANLTSLPLGNLLALKHVEISECPQLQFSNVEQLSSKLRVLRIDGCPIVAKWCRRHRQRLAHVTRLEIDGVYDCYLLLRNGLSVHEAVYKHLPNLKGVRMLELEWDSTSSADATADEVLEKLRPEISLGRLGIRGYMGLRFPSWLGDRSFCNLFSVMLVQCSHCVNLPPLGQLPNLVNLYVEGAHRLKSIGHEFSDAGSRSASSQRSAPPSFKTLKDHDIPVWEWDSEGRKESDFPLLYKFTNDGLQRRSFPALTKLEFHDMPMWEGWWGVKQGDFPSLCKLILKHCPRLGALPPLPPSLKELELEACEQLVSLSAFSSSSQGLQALMSLRHLSPTDCPQLDFSASGRLPSTLQRMTLTRCPPLVRWCDEQLSMLVGIPEIWVDGIRVTPKMGKELGLKWKRQ